MVSVEIAVRVSRMSPGGKLELKGFVPVKSILIVCITLRLALKSCSAPVRATTIISSAGCPSGSQVVDPDMDSAAVFKVPRDGSNPGKGELEKV